MNGPRWPRSILVDNIFIVPEADHPCPQIRTGSLCSALCSALSAESLGSSCQISLYTDAVTNINCFGCLSSNHYVDVTKVPTGHTLFSVNVFIRPWSSSTGLLWKESHISTPRNWHHWLFYTWQNSYWKREHELLKTFSLHSSSFHSDHWYNHVLHVQFYL